MQCMHHHWVSSSTSRNCENTSQFAVCMERVSAVEVLTWVRAARASHDQTVQRQAIEHCEVIRTRPDAFRLVLALLPELLLSPGEDQAAAAFWLLDVLCSCISRNWTVLSDEDRNQVRSWLMIFVRDQFPQLHLPSCKLLMIMLLTCADFKNKLALVFVQLIRVDFPKAWSSFFSDFMGLLEISKLNIDLFLRVLQTLDEDVLSVASTNREDIAIKTDIVNAFRHLFVSKLASETEFEIIVLNYLLLFGWPFLKVWNQNLN